MKTFFKALVLIFALLASTTSFALVDAIYEGGFSEVNSTGEACDEIFAVPDYTVKFFFAGPTGYTTVIYFENEEDRGFLNTVNMVGRMGGSGDVLYQKAIHRQDLNYRFEAEGIVSRDLLLLEFSVKVTDGDDEPVCNVTSEYFGHNEE